MPKLNAGNIINGLITGEFDEVYGRVYRRRYLAYARLTTTPQLQIPLMVPSRDKGKADTALTIPAETIYSVRAWRGVGTTMSASGNVKIANALADSGFVIATASGAGAIPPGFQLNGIGLPGTTLAAPLGVNATPNLPLSLFATAAVTTTAAAVGLAVSPTSLDALDTYQRANFTGDRLNTILVEIQTFALDSGTAMTVANPFQYEVALQDVWKGM